MKGEAKSFLKFLDGSDKRFIIPVYQRNYNWQIKHCKQLLDDLLTLIEQPLKPHFFGSVVSSNMENGNREDYLIIDGQQRLTTVSILLVAMVNLLEKKLVQVNDSKLKDKIKNRHLVDEYNTEFRKIRLKPINEDRQAFDALFEDEVDFIATSNVTANYYFFKNEIINKSIDLEHLYDAISRLEIIDIFLEKSDDPQLIFESLNSTGLALEEGDKIRNYILMSLPPVVQEQYYVKYWHRIEKKTEFDNYYYVSDFIKSYLTLKLGKTIVIRDIYFYFKDFAKGYQKEALLIDLLHYASLYEKLLKPTGRTNDLEPNIIRLNQLDLTVIHPFLLAILDHISKGKLTEKEAKDIFSIIESYIFRRLIVGLASNSLNKFFATLDKDISKRQNNNQSYAEICKFILLSKEQSLRFPTDEEFIEMLMTRNIYALSSGNKQYLFSRLENSNSREQINVIERLQNSEYSIEHIMPQNLNNEWKESLGQNFTEIHNKWLHTLPNLTLTAYNSKYSNHSFDVKLTIENGFKESNLRLNKFVSECYSWTEKELLARQHILEEEAKKLWPFPCSVYVSPKQEVSSYSLEDDFDFTGINLSSYEFLGEEKPFSNWKNLLGDVITSLIVLYPAKMQQLALEDGGYIAKTKLSNSYSLLGDYFIYANCNTSAKIQGLKSFFKQCDIPFEELTFNILTKSN
ncbi:DUF262 domain-containing protein [Orbus sasakiae]|uniref:DUF262 domain-containing protein n=1 Tax=Orbus sasakiae TaxID=1078475 RepID=A0ABP9N6I4_9GAMM